MTAIYRGYPLPMYFLFLCIQTETNQVSIHYTLYVKLSTRKDIWKRNSESGNKASFCEKMKTKEACLSLPY